MNLMLIYSDGPVLEALLALAGTTVAETLRNIVVCGLLVALLAVAAIAAVVSPARAQDSVDDLVERHLEWLGGAERLAAVKTFDFQGVMETAGLTGTVRMRLQRPDRDRFEYDLTVVDGVEVYTPEDPWRKNENGQIEDLGRESAGVHLHAITQAFALHFLEERGETVIEDGGVQEREGRSWRVLHITEKHGGRQSLYLDPKTGEPLGAEVTLDTDTYWSTSSDWRRVGGIRIPFLEEQIYEDATRNLTLRWNTVEADVSLDDAVFARPAETNSAGGFAGDMTSSGWIDIELYSGRYIYIDGKINGQESRILLDSGAGMTVVSQSVADRIGLETAGQLPAQGVTGTTTASIAEGVDIELGAVRLHDLRVAVIDLSPIEKMMPHGLPVILGKEVFHRFIVDIDYPNERIAFHEPEGFSYEGPGQSLELIADDGGHKAVEVRIEDRDPVLVKVDTGAGDALSIFESYTKAQGLLDGREHISDAVSGGVGGDSRVISRMATLHSFEIAGYRFDNVPASFHDATGAFDTHILAGNMGAGILGRFRCLFDYTSDRLILEPGDDWKQPFRRDRLGISIEDTGDGIEVIHVATGSPAAAAGWKVGDRVVSINGDPLEGDPYLIWKFNARKDPGTKVVVKGADGRVSEMVLADYF